MAIGLIANAWFVWTTDARLERQLAEIRAAGDPLTLADLARPPIPPEKNAATYLRQADADVKAIEAKIFNKDYFDGWGKQWSSENRLPSEGVKAVKAAMDAHPQAIPLLKQAAACEDYDAELDYSAAPAQLIAQLLPVAQGFRCYARVLEFRTHLLLAEGNYDEAAKNSLILFQISRLFNRNPMIVSYLVATTIRGIATNSLNRVLQIGPVSKDVRAALDAEISIQERMAGYDGYGWMITSERALALDLLQTFPDRNFWFVSRGVWNRRESAVLDWFGGWLKIAKDSSPYCQTEKAIHRLSEQVPTLDLPLLPAKIWGEPVDLLPATQAAHNAITRSRAMIRCLRVLNALQAHVPAGSNEIPKLTELGLPAETITDPFTGDPLHVKKTPQGWVVYSVGPNFQDDGGKVDDPTNGDVGIGPPPAAKAAKQ